MKTRIALCALALGTALVAADDAWAKGGRVGKNRPQTVNMSRPSDGPDADAQGTVKVHAGKGGNQTVVSLAKLKPRTTYELRDADSGDLLGTVKTDRKGKATFNLTKSLTKSASLAGSDATPVGNVEVVDPASGDTVLEGDVDPPAPVASDGYGDYSGADSYAGVYMATDPDYGDSFSITFYPPTDPGADPAAQTFSYFEYDAKGGDLPLGVASVAELAGRAFEIRSTSDGSAAISGDLPELTPIDQSWNDLNRDDSGEVWSDDGSGDWNWDDWGADWGDDSGSYDCNGVQDPAGAGQNGRTKSAKKPAAGKGKQPAPGKEQKPAAGKEKKPVAGNGGGKKDDVASGFTLFIADENGDLRKAAKLDERPFDDGGDWSDDGNYDDWGSYDPFAGMDGMMIIVIVLPSDGSFDLDAFLEQLASYGFDWSSYDPSAGVDPGASDGAAVKHRHKRN